MIGGWVGMVVCYLRHRLGYVWAETAPALVIVAAVRCGKLRVEVAVSSGQQNI
jgi:hypothetical protein